MIPTQVFIKRVSDKCDIELSISKACEQLELASDIRPWTRVSIKPNLTYPSYKRGVTTSPAVLEATVRALRQYTSHIRIVESDAGAGAWTAEQAFAGHDVPLICRKYGATAVGLTQQPRRCGSTTVGNRQIEIELPTLLLEETDFFITIPVPKMHAMTGVSLGFKNQWGCIPDQKRLLHHAQFAHKVIAINKLLKVKLAIFDGVFFLNRSGPLEGDPVQKNLIIAGEVGLATTACCTLMQVNPLQVPHLRLAVQEGLMPANLNESQCNVDLDALCSTKFSLHRRPLDWLALAVFNSQWATKLCYNSALALPLHSLAYMLKGKPKDFVPKW